jgi:phosphatidylserine/phosphatidylglycerophosphate/cardiolipin synthase-like enzyme
MPFLRKISAILAFVCVFAGFATVAYYIAHENDPVVRLKKQLINEKGEVAAAFFSPDDDLRTMLVSLINAENKRIRIAIYTLTDKTITQALLAAQRRWVTVECIVDRGYGNDMYSKVGQLAQAKVPIWVYQTAADDRSAALMHNKVALFDDSIDHKSIVWTGSYNFTVRASDRNQENVVILDNPAIFRRFGEQFELLKTRSLQISGEIQTTGTASAPKPEPTWIDKAFNLFRS